jgi:hypothetical protein
VENLHRTGFSRDEIGVFMGAEGVAKLDSATGKKGFLAKLTMIKTSTIATGNEEMVRKIKALCCGL